MLSCNLDPRYLLFNSLEVSFPTRSLQIYCIELFGPKSYYFLGLGTKLCPFKIYIYIYTHIKTFYRPGNVGTHLFWKKSTSLQNWIEWEFRYTPFQTSNSPVQFANNILKNLKILPHIKWHFNVQVSPTIY